MNPKFAVSKSIFALSLFASAVAMANSPVGTWKAGCHWENDGNHHINQMVFAGDTLTRSYSVYSDDKCEWRTATWTDVATFSVGSKHGEGIAIDFVTSNGVEFGIFKIEGDQIFMSFTETSASRRPESVYREIPYGRQGARLMDGARNASLEGIWNSSCILVEEGYSMLQHVEFDSGLYSMYLQVFEGKNCKGEMVSDGNSTAYYSVGEKFGEGTSLDLQDDVSSSYTIFKIEGDQLYFGEFALGESSRPSVVNRANVYTRKN